MDIILKYFPDLAESQKACFGMMFDLYYDWNSKINVISRKDIGNLYLHHVLHSLAISKILKFKPQTSVVDVGTGGGFPAVPLAVLFPETRFCLVDSVGKKIKATAGIVNSLGLKNCVFVNDRMENVKEKFEFAVSRAVMPLADLIKVLRKNIAREQKNALPNGIICLKGGELQHETAPFKNSATLYNISDFFEEEYFKTKKAVYLPIL
ncbi:MAG: 16S rRNA (guanine(527)-N(7))-methyltransferase RsmG [Prevotellaceae bacterium]|jgi:16S rRNA (guanine527-N7)-methyltransferase|nr:16S rRNA (guanine(527)-N(7))-methyltransferase RsmG [Prevotellaceae bacterium]